MTGDGERSGAPRTGSATNGEPPRATPPSAAPSPPAAPSPAARAVPGRLLALDRMRGLVMVLMAVDHAGAAFDAGHLAVDSAVRYRPGVELPLANLLTRWITHLCAPSFLFLAGAAVALSIERRRRAGRGERGVDRHLLLRGALILALDPLWVSLCWRPTSRFFIVILQVLFAIGASLILLVPLRRLPSAALVALAALILAGNEAFVGLFVDFASGAPPPLWLALLSAQGFYGGPGGAVAVFYCVLPWLAMMLLGVAFGRRLLGRMERGASPVRELLGLGLGGLALFAVTSGLNGYGNMQLWRGDGSLAQWLLVSKYPPSLAFAGLTLGAMALLLAGFFRREGRAAEPASPRGVLVVLGQVPLFFYLLHLPVVGLLALATGGLGERGLGAAWLGAAATVTLLWPACLAYRAYKARHPHGWTRYL